MRYTTLRLTVIFLISIMITVSWTGVGKSQYQQEGSKKDPPAVPPIFPQEVPPVVSPEGWVLFKEIYLIQFHDEIEHHFHRVRENFLKEKEIAAADMRKAAVFMRLEAARATEEGKKGLMVAIHAIDKLADKVEEGTALSIKELDQAFVRAHFALAEHHYLKAKELWSKKDAKKVGYDLKAAALHLENALTWSGHTLEVGVVAVIEDARFLPGEMIEGTGWVIEEEGKAIEKIGKKIEKLSKKIKPEVKK